MACPSSRPPAAYSSRPAERPKPLFQETVANLKHKVPAEAVAAYLKPVMTLHYAAGRLTFAQPLSIDGVSPDNYYISGVTAKSGVLYVLEINASRIYRLSGAELREATLGRNRQSSLRRRTLAGRPHARRLQLGRRIGEPARSRDTEGTRPHHRPAATPTK